MDRTENLNKDDVTGYALTFAKLGKIGTGMTTRGGVELQFLLNPVFKRACPQWHRYDSEVELCSGGGGVRWVKGNNIAIERGLLSSPSTPTFKM